MTIGGVSSAVSSGASSQIVSAVSSAMAAVADAGVRVSISQSAADAVNLQQDLTRLNIATAVLKSEFQSEQAIVKMIQESIDLRV